MKSDNSAIISLTTHKNFSVTSFIADTWIIDTHLTAVITVDSFRKPKA